MISKKVITAALLATALLMAACGSNADKAIIVSAETGERQAEAAPAGQNGGQAERLGEIEPLDVEAEYRTVGSFFAKEEITISTKVGGTLLKINVDTGDQVGPKTVIGQIDEEDFQLAVRNAEAQLAVAQANLNNARNEFARKKQLFEEEAITQSTFDLVKTNLELAEAQIESARVAVELAEKAKRDTKIVAGTTGIVSNRMVSAGEFLDKGQPLVVISQVKPIEMHLSVPERLAPDICEGDVVRARLAAFPGRYFVGEVTLVSPTIDAATRTVPIEADFPNKEGVLKPGYFAESTIILCNARQHFLVVADALFEIEGGHEVQVKTEDGYRPVPVIYIETRGTRILIACEFEGDLSGGEQVLLK